jgi:hypothetical protein
MKSIALSILSASLLLSSCVVPPGPHSLLTPIDSDTPRHHDHDHDRDDDRRWRDDDDFGRSHRSEAYNLGYDAGRSDRRRGLSPDARYAFTHSGLRNGELTFREAYEEGYRSRR